MSAGLFVSFAVSLSVSYSELVPVFYLDCKDGRYDEDGYQYDQGTKYLGQANPTEESTLLREAAKKLFFLLARPLRP